MGELVIEMRDVRKQLPNGSTILDGISLRLGPNNSCALVGRSGSGKTTLLSILGLIEPMDSGEYRLNGLDVAKVKNSQIEEARGGLIGYVYQNFSLVGHLSALDNVASSLIHSRQPMTHRERLRRAHDYLERVSMGAHSKKRPSQLSGGEQQRVAIARALVRKPSLILADEPTGALDEQTGDSVLNLLKERVNDDEAALIVVTHDASVARRLDQSYRLENGILTVERPKHRALESRPGDRLTHA